MHYFSKVKLGDEVFSLIYGKGVVTLALPKKQRLDGFYIFAAEYKKEKKVHYTIDGVPDWSSSDGQQTVFYIKDIDLSEIDIQASGKLLTQKQILKYSEKGILEVRCPSGIWRNVNESPNSIMKKALKKSKHFLFRKQKD